VEAHRAVLAARARRQSRHVPVLACLDNLIQGAAAVAVQDLNLMLGCPEETALL
jgi:N-acetyl-gamma-glutamylphosphate reductase